MRCDRNARRSVTDFEILSRGGADRSIHVEGGRGQVRTDSHLTRRVYEKPRRIRDAVVDEEVPRIIYADVHSYFESGSVVGVHLDPRSFIGCGACGNADVRMRGSYDSAASNPDARSRYDERLRFLFYRFVRVIHEGIPVRRAQLSPACGLGKAGIRREKSSSGKRERSEGERRASEYVFHFSNRFQLP